MQPDNIYFLALFRFPLKYILRNIAILRTILKEQLGSYIYVGGMNFTYY